MLILSQEGSSQDGLYMPPSSACVSAAASCAQTCAHLRLGRWPMAWATLLPCERVASICFSAAPCMLAASSDDRCAHLCFCLRWACWPLCHHVWLMRRYSHEMRTLFDAAFRGDADVRISCLAALSGLKCTSAVMLVFHTAHRHAILDVLLLCRCASPLLALMWRGSTPAQPGRPASAACTGWRVLSPGWPTAMAVRPCMQLG